MKANELMIGDWIEPHQCRIPTVYARVEGIYPAGITIDKAERVFSFDEIHPIPLTPEILEKNGFEKSYSNILTTDGYKKLPQYKYKNMTQVQDICRNLITISYSDLEGGVYDIQCGIGSHIYGLKYVHQLQHALRLSGIDKTIEL